MKVKESVVTFERTWNTGDFESFTAGFSVWYEDNSSVSCNPEMRKLARLNVLSQFNKLNGEGNVIEVNIPDIVKIKTVSVTLSKRVNLGDYEGAKVLHTDWADVDDVFKDTNRLWKQVWKNLNNEVAILKGEEVVPEEPSW